MLLFKGVADVSYTYQMAIRPCIILNTEKSTVKEVTVELAAVGVSKDVRKIFIGEYSLRF